MTLAEIRGANLYLDSNVLIYAFEGGPDAPRRTAGQLLREIYTQRCSAATSIIARTEVLVRPLRLRQTVLANRYRALLSTGSPIVSHTVDERIAESAAELRADYPALKLPDAMHVATAICIGCDALVTSDKRLRIVSARIAVLSLDLFSST